MSADDLVEIKINFFIGNYGSAVNEAEALTGLPVALDAERKLFLYRSHLAQGNYSFILDEVWELFFFFFFFFFLFFLILFFFLFLFLFFFFLFCFVRLTKMPMMN